MEKMENPVSCKSSKSGWMNTIKFQISSWRNRIKLHIYPHWLLLLVILVLAAFLRLYRIEDYMTFLGDEGRDALVVYNILHGRLTLLGPTSSVGGFFLGPIYYYFIAPFLWLFNYNPSGPATMVAIFGVATVWLVYKIGNEFFNRKAGLIACGLYAISPLVIAYSRSSWNPNLMPFFSLLTIYVLYKAVLLRKNKLFLLGGFLLGISIQLHYVILFLIAISVIYIFIAEIFDLRFSLIQKIKTLAISYFSILLGYLIGWLPFLFFELRHGFPNIQSIITFIFNSSEVGSGKSFSSSIEGLLLQLFGRLITKFPPPEQILANNSIITFDYYFFSFKANASYLLYITILITIASLCFLLYRFLKALRDREDFLKYSSLIIWLFVGIIIFSFYKKSIHDYYLEFMFPLPFLLLGGVLSLLISQRGFLKVISLLILFWLVVQNLSGVPFRYAANKQYEQVKNIAMFALSKAENKPFNFALITSGNSDHAYRYFFELEKKSPLTIENSQIDLERKSVTDQLIIICEHPDCQPLGNSLWEVAGFGRAEITGKWEVPFVTVYKLKHYKDKQF